MASSISPPAAITTWRPTGPRYADYREGAATNGPDIDDNFEGSFDVNNDGRPDVLSSGWMLRQGIFWYENPGRAGAKWP